MTWEIFRVMPFVAQVAVVFFVGAPALAVLAAAIVYGPGLLRK